MKFEAKANNLILRPFRNVVRGFNLVHTTLKGHAVQIWGGDSLEMPELEREVRIKQPHVA